MQVVTLELEELWPGVTSDSWIILYLLQRRTAHYGIISTWITVRWSYSCYFYFFYFGGKGGGVLFTEACWQKYLEPENGLLWGDLIIHILILYFFKEISHPCIYFFLGTIITIPSPYQKVKIRVQKVYFFWYRCVSDHLALYFYVCMHACTRLYVVWTERKRKIDVQLWLIPTDSKKLTNTAWPCVIDIWITVICLYRNYKSNSNINYAVNRLALAQQQQEQQIQTKLTSFKGMSNC